jgi:hypothetical protein
MSKLKIFTTDIIVNDICEEQLLYLGKVDNRIIKSNKTFTDISNDDINNLVEYTDVAECDFIYYPHKINKNSNIEELIKLSDNFDKKILLFYNDDDDSIFNFKNSVIFRTSLYKSNKLDNYQSLPAFCNDIGRNIDCLRDKSEIPTIGFCGAITHPIRKIVIDEIDKSNLNTNFIIRNNFWGGDVWGTNVRTDYVNNLLNSDFIICVRGAGNFSYRFYETLCLGRIPIVIDTDIDLPFNDFIEYDNLVLKVNNVEEIEQKVLEYWNNIVDYHKLQQDLRIFWIDNLSPTGFINNLNKYKNKIK